MSEEASTNPPWVLYLLIFCFAITAIFMAIVLLQYDFKSYSRVEMAKHYMHNLAKLLDQYKQDYGKYPEQEDNGLLALGKKGSHGKRYVRKEILRDPWKKEYIYQSDGKSFKITCLGADGKEGGEGENQDVIVTSSKN